MRSRIRCLSTGAEKRGRLRRTFSADSCFYETTGNRPRNAHRNTCEAALKAIQDRG